MASDLSWPSTCVNYSGSAVCQWTLRLSMWTRLRTQKKTSIMPSWLLDAMELH
ncbi:hypothetical protein FQN60_002431 [Etheostoma spectabile]|uniref:Uncharacterized protein n=1 Tax=Etheostoma spectabile TaxID=54343 RepID=A0A5J5D9Z7_9PERO|nr:hypothetical protein FQN60_002431 [Etheostoma spectabile]